MASGVRSTAVVMYSRKKEKKNRRRRLTFMKSLVGLRSPEVPGFCPSIGAVDTEVTARAPRPFNDVGMCGRGRQAHKRLHCGDGERASAQIEGTEQQTAKKRYKKTATQVAGKESDAGRQDEARRKEKNDSTKQAARETRQKRKKRKKKKEAKATSRGERAREEGS